MYIILLSHVDNSWIEVALINRANMSTFEFNNICENLANVQVLTRQNRIEIENNHDKSLAMIKFDNFTDEITMLMREVGYRKCTICGSWVSPQEVRIGNSYNNRGYDSNLRPTSYWDSNSETRYCKVCSAKKQGRDNIYNFIRLNDYHSSNRNGNYPLLKVDNDTTLDNTLGIELEGSTSYRDSRGIKCNEAFYNMYQNGQVFVESDATVSFELITSIMTESYANNFDWSILTDVLKLNRCDDTRNSVGLHIHITNKILGRTEKEKAINYLKLYYLANCYKSDFIKVSGRNEGDTRWCTFYTNQQIAELKRMIEQRSNPTLDNSFTDSHGYAFIVSGHNTIEVRIGHSTNDPERLKNYVLFIYYVVKGLKGLPWNKVYCMRKAFRLVPKSIMTYWRNKGCFLNTNARTIQGIEFNQTQAQ